MKLLYSREWLGLGMLNGVLFSLCQPLEVSCFLMSAFLEMDAGACLENYWIVLGWLHWHLSFPWIFRLSSLHDAPISSFLMSEGVALYLETYIASG